MKKSLDEEWWDDFNNWTDFLAELEDTLPGVLDSIDGALNVDNVLTADRFRAEICATYNLLGMLKEPTSEVPAACAAIKQHLSDNPEVIARWLLVR